VGGLPGSLVESFREPGEPSLAGSGRVWLDSRRATRYKSRRLVCLGSRWEPGTAHATVSAESWSKKATGAKALGRPLWIDNARVRRPTGLSRQLDSTSMGESMGASGQSINLTSLAKKLEGVFPSEG